LDIWVVAALAVIIASIVYSAWKQTSFSIIASIACVAVFIIGLVSQAELGFAPHDLFDASREYTLLTSMFMHKNFSHIFLNLLALVMLGLVFEQRIGTRPFIVLYLIAGVVGTLVFAAVRWNGIIPVVGASGAISGILGGFARLYPNEKMIIFPFPVPMSIWTVVLAFLVLQIVILFSIEEVAIESHLGGLAAGILLAPLIVRLPLGQRTPARRTQTLSVGQIRRLATTPQLRSMLERIEKEEVADVRGAWLEHFLSIAKCPQCGSRLKVENGTITCEKGHIV